MNERAITHRETRWKTKREIAAHLGVSIRTIGYWTKDGTLPFLKRGAVVRFNVEDCDAALRKFYRRARFPSEDENPGTE